MEKFNMRYRRGKSGKSF